MFVVGLLLYFGETVFFKCGEEGTFTVHVKPLKGDIIEVSGCKGTETLGSFLEKFEKAYEKNTGVKIKELKYRVVYNTQLIVKDSLPVKDISLENLEIYENCVLSLVFPMKNVTKNEELSNLCIDNEYEDNAFLNIDKKPIKIRRRDRIDGMISNKFFQNEPTIDPQNDKANPNSEFASKEENLTNLGNENIHKDPTKLLSFDNLKKKKIPATSTCPCRRVCMLCGC